MPGCAGKALTTMSHPRHDPERQSSRPMDSMLGDLAQSAADSLFTSESQRLAAEYRPGNVLNDQYEIVRCLGQGGMGIVFLARDRVFDKDVAIKMILPDFVEAGAARQRFLNEMRVLRDVYHENIVRAYSGHIDQKSQLPYIVMEYVEGESLAEYVARNGGTLPVDEVVAIMDQICNGLAATHPTLIHRDLKPQNVIRRQDGRVKILDFGLAKVLDEDGYTRTMLGLGTPRYLSPEQANDAKRVDHRTDIYSLGIMLYEFLTGSLAVGNFDSASTFNRSLPKKIDKVVERSLARLDNRYTSVAEFMDDLRLATRPRRFGAGAVKKIAAAAVILLVAGGAFGLWRGGLMGDAFGNVQRWFETEGESTPDAQPALPGPTDPNKIRLAQADEAPPVNSAPPPESTSVEPLREDQQSIDILQRPPAAEPEQRVEAIFDEPESVESGEVPSATDGVDASQPADEPVLVQQSTPVEAPPAAEPEPMPEPIVVARERPRDPPPRQERVEEPPASTPVAPAVLAARNTRIDGPNGSATIEVTRASAPVAAREIGSARILEGKEWMFNVSKTNNCVIVRPNDRAEYGAYKLAVSVDGRTLTTDFTYAGQMAAAGSGLWLRPDLGLAQTYSEGSVLTVSIDDAPAGYLYEWTVNGRRHLSQPDARKMSVTLSEPGPLNIQVRLLEGGREVAKASGTSNVAPTPRQFWTTPVAVECNTGDALPAGFQRYEWKVDGALVSNERVLRHTFQRPGTYQVDGYAYNPAANSTTKTYDHQAYNLVVTEWREDAR